MEDDPGLLGYVDGVSETGAVVSVHGRWWRANIYYNNSPSAYTYGLFGLKNIKRQVVIHEIGHALKLEHPREEVGHSYICMMTAGIYSTDTV